VCTRRKREGAVIKGEINLGKSLSDLVEARGGVRGDGGGVKVVGSRGVELHAIKPLVLELAHQRLVTGLFFFFVPGTVTATKQHRVQAYS